MQEHNLNKIIHNLFLRLDELKQTVLHHEQHLQIYYLIHDALLTFALEKWVDKGTIETILKRYVACVELLKTQHQRVEEADRIKQAGLLAQTLGWPTLAYALSQLKADTLEHLHHWPKIYDKELDQKLIQKALKLASFESYIELWRERYHAWQLADSQHKAEAQRVLDELEDRYECYLMHPIVLVSCNRARFKDITTFKKAYASLESLAQKLSQRHVWVSAIKLYRDVLAHALSGQNPLMAAFDRGQVLEALQQHLAAMASPPASPLYSHRWGTYQAELKEARDRLPKQVTAEAMVNVTQSITVSYQTLISRVLNDIESLLGVAPCAYAFLGFGSYARQQMLPYSDMEGLLLLESNSPDHHLYFKTLFKLFLFRIETLGESMPDQLGFHWDGAIKLEGEDPCLWGIPEQVVKALLADSKDKTEQSHQGILALSVLHSAWVYGDRSLVERFDKGLAKHYTASLKANDSTPPIQRLALTRLKSNVLQFQQDYPIHLQTPPHSIPEVNNKGIKKEAGFVNIKHDYAAWLQYFMTGLGLYHGIQATQLSEILQALVEQNKLERHFAAYSEALLNAITALRFKVQCHYQGAVDFARWPALADPSFPSPKPGVLWYDLNSEECRLLLTFEHSVLRPLCRTLERAFQSDQELNQRLDPWGELQQALQIQEAVETQPVFQSFLNWLNLSNANKLLDVDLTQCARAIQCFLDSFLYLESSTLLSPFDRVAAKQHRAFYLELPPSLRPLYLYYLEQRLKEYPDHPVLQKLTALPEPNGDRAITWKRQRAWIALLQKVLIPISTTKADELRQQGKLVVTAYDLQQTSYTKLQHYQVPPELEPYILNPETQNWKKKEATQPGRHTVFEMAVGEDKLWWKLCPEQPGTERLVYSLSERLCGGGTPPNLIVKCELKGQVYGVQLSQHVPGDDLQAVLDKQPERLQRIPLSQFIAALLRVLQTNPEDDKPDDYRLKLTANQTELLSRLDNERAFYTPEEEHTFLWLTAKKFLQVKSAILCFDQMVMPWSKEEIEDYLLLNPALIIESEIREAKHYHAYFKTLFKIDTEKTDPEKIIKDHYQTILYQNPDLPGPSMLTVAMAQGWVKEQWNRLTSLQTVIKNALKQNTSVTGLLLLETVQPVLAAHYKKAFQAYPVTSPDPGRVSQRFEQVTQGLYETVQGHHQSRMPTVEAVTKSLRLKVKLNVQEVIRIYRGEILSPLQAEEELNAIKATHKEQLLAALLAGESGSQAVFHSLTSPHQTSLIEKVIADLHQNPKAYSPKAQQNLLKAMASLCFHHLHLSVFREVLTDGLLIPLLKSSGASLLSLDVSHCLKITVASLNVWLTDCPNLQTLNLQHCSQLTDAGLVPGSEAPLSLIELKLTGSGLAQSSRIIALLEGYPFLLGLANWDEFTKTAQAALYEAMKEAATSKEAGAREAKYDIRSFFKQWLAYREQVISILISSLGKTQPIFLGGEERYTRSNCAEALGYLQQSSLMIVKALLVALKDSHKCVRHSAAQSLDQLGGSHSELVVPASLKVLEDNKDDGVRSRAADSLGQIEEGHANRIVPELLEMLEHWRGTARSSAADSLGQIGGNHADLVVPALLKALEDMDYKVRSQAAKSLGKIGVGCSDLVVSTLLARLNNYDFNAANILSQWLSPTHPGLKHQLKKIMAPYSNTSKTLPHAPVSPTEKPPASTAAFTYPLHTTPTLFFNPPPSSHLTTNDNNNNNAQTLTSVAEALDVQQASIHSLNPMHHS